MVKVKTDKIMGLIYELEVIEYNNGSLNTMRKHYIPPEYSEEYIIEQQGKIVPSILQKLEQIQDAISEYATAMIIEDRKQR